MELTITTESYSNADMDFDLYVASPQNHTEKLPAILISHAWDGLNTPMEDITRRVAKLGYIAVAVDVYGKGVRGEPTGDNTHLMAPLMEDRALLNDRLTAAYNTIRAMAKVDNSRIGAMGYCFGGMCALDLARSAPDDLNAVVSFHGGLSDNKLHDAKSINASVLIEHGWSDPMVPQEEYLNFAKEMGRKNADWQAHIHGGALHAFTFKGANMPEKGINYHEAADRRSWKSMVDFFAEEL